jgi:hypothetical protein
LHVQHRAGPASIRQAIHANAVINPKAAKTARIEVVISAPSPPT